MKKNSKEVKIGFAFIVAIFTLYYGISFLKGINKFKPANSYMVAFDNVEGLTQSAPIKLNGFQVGLVYSMELDANNSNHVIAHLNMDKAIKIPKGSKLSLNASMLGGATLDLILNPYTEELYTALDTIPGTRKKGLMDTADGLAPQLETLLPKIDSILSGIEKLVNSPELGQALSNMNQITSNLAQSSNQLTTITANLNKEMPAITGNMNQITSDLTEFTGKFKSMDIESTFKSVDATMKNLEQMSSKISAKDSSLGLLLNDRALYDSLNTTVGNASTLLRDVKENPSRYINVKVF